MFRKIVEVSSQIPKRDKSTVLAKLTEEIGEIAVEIEIERGNIPASKGGNDGVFGECCDLINVAVDMAWVHCKETQDMSDEQIAELILSYCLRKREKLLESKAWMVNCQEEWEAMCNE
ncbi:hypothetical protein JCM19235_2280 [Vibrio maritimus]|uniref:NTP pyrophosphohydrolase MazG putative catalytic core domain-containing protein n=1 Tax=Vibrio maritimus TaxID=990268 RepID=A0A090SHA5_9VIBR|nr:hypothetical protein JCM19235_2280 [Vibrio maritimus]